MDQPSQKLADRYLLQLNDGWKRWFDRQDPLPLPGAFQFRVDIEDLTAAAPRCIWPAFMLPDSLPIVGNGYGDWFCLRIDQHGQPSEVIHWYHGGGDWIPVGATIEQAILHDVVDQFRPLQRQMLRGAGETLGVDHLQHVRQAIEDATFRNWLRDSLTTQDGAGADSKAIGLDRLLAALVEDRYADALAIMREQNWAVAAATCDDVEAALQFANTAELQSLADQLYSGNPRATARFLFDPEQHVAPESSESSKVLNDLPHEHRPAADWGMIEQLCVLVSHQRNDLAWVHDLLGWCHERQGRRAQAAAAYYAGRHAPAFTNQAVRLRTHWYDQQYGKFSIAQLLQLQKSHHQPEAGSELRHDDDQQSDVWEQIQSDPYLQLFPGAPAQLLARVTEYWEQQAQEHFAAERYEAAYHCFVQAGWDLGAPSIDAYRRILQSIVDAAAQANWPARARIAETHLHCLTKR